MAKVPSEMKVGDVPLFRHAYSPRFSVSIDCASMPSLTKQSFKDECDINVIMKRFEATGILPPAAGEAPRYLDCSGVDFQEAMLVVASAKSLFAQLPARVRDRFDNDPKRMVEFVDDPRNVEEARELGLLKPKEAEATPLAVRVVEPAVAHPSETSKVSEGGGPRPSAVERRPKGGDS